MDNTELVRVLRDLTDQRDAARQRCATLERERDELRATVERLKALCREVADEIKGISDDQFSTYEACVRLREAGGK